MPEKTKARDILICWPVPRSTSTPFEKESLAWMRFCGKEWNGVDRHRLENERGLERMYHNRQTEMVENFRTSEKQMAALRLHCQMITQRRREQCVLLYTSGGHQPVVVTHHGYPGGLEMIQAGLCGVGAATPMGCMFCQYGHMTECHFPRNCQDARCSHLMRYVDEVMPPATETVQ